MRVSVPGASLSGVNFLLVACWAGLQAIVASQEATHLCASFLHELVRIVRVLGEVVRSYCGAIRNMVTH